MIRTLACSTALAALVLTGGCAKVRARQGYILDQTLVAAIQPGVDNRDSVARTLGRPTFAGQFDANDWYYIERETRQLAFGQPEATTQTLLHVRFDAAGNVSAVEKSGVEKIASIDPMGDKTPTLGRDRSFFEDVFGNIGQVGSVGQGGGTADNPGGGN